jgi:hypothetical protein
VTPRDACPTPLAVSPRFPPQSDARVARDGPASRHRRPRNQGPLSHRPQAQPQRSSGWPDGVDAADLAHRRGTRGCLGRDDALPTCDDETCGTRRRRTHVGSSPPTPKDGTTRGTRCIAAAATRSVSCPASRQPPLPAAPTARAGWVTIPPPLPGAEEGGVGHDPAAGWVTEYPALTVSAHFAAAGWTYTGPSKLLRASRSR